MSRVQCRASIFLIAIIGSLLLLSMLPLPALADGGAPNLAYVAGTGQGISIIDIVQQKVTGSIALSGEPQTLYLSIDGRFLYVTRPATDQVSMLAAKTSQVLCSAHISGNPTFLVFDPASNSLFVGGSQTAVISNISLSNCQILHTIQAPGPVSGLAVVEVAGGDNQLWVASGNGLSVFDARTRERRASFALPATPHALLAIPQGTWVYVTTEQGFVYAVDIHAYHLLTLLAGGQYGTMDFDQVTGEIYLPDQKHNQLDVLTPPDPEASVAPREPNHLYHFAAAPRSVAITSDGAFGFVALASGQVAMLDIAGKQVVETFVVGGSPRFVITGLYPPVIGTTPQQAAIADTYGTALTDILVLLVLLSPFILIWWRRRKRRRSRQAELKNYQEPPRASAEHADVMEDEWYDGGSGEPRKSVESVPPVDPGPD